MKGIDWRAILNRAAPTLGAWAGLLLFWWLHRELGTLISGLILAGLIGSVLLFTTIHCYLRLHRGGTTRQAAFRSCLSWMRS